MQNSCIKASYSEQLFGIKIDSDLTFHDHIKLYAQKLIQNVLYQEYQSTKA